MGFFTRGGVAAMFAVAWVVACSTATSGGGEKQAAVSKTVGSAGGVVAAPDGTTVDIPPGALTGDTMITVTPAPDTQLPTDIQGIGTPYVFGPEGTTFAKPVTVTLAFSPEKLGNHAMADIVVLTAPVGSNAYAPLRPTTVDGAKAKAGTTHFSVFVAGVVNCTANCSGSAAQGGPANCSCQSTCLGTTYTMDCPAGSCTCQDGKKGSTTCTDPSAAQQTFQTLCGYPGGGGAGGAPEVGTDASTDNCVVSCHGSQSSGGGATCGCDVVCDGVTYAMDCTNAGCTCTNSGNVVKNAPALDCGKGPAICNDFLGSTCGFPGTCTSGGSDAGADGSADNDAGTCAKSCGGSSGSCNCNEDCAGHSYTLDCTGNTCTCKTDGSTTKTFNLVSPTCMGTEWTTCGYP